MHILRYIGLVSVIAVSSYSQDVPVWARMYEGFGQTGREFFTADYLSDLADYGFDNVAHSVCAAGVWVLFDAHDYNGVNLVVMGTGECIDLPQDIAGNVTSIRQAGSPSNTSASTLTLFSYSQFRGYELYLTKDERTLGLFDDQAYSAIVTGDQAWTVYTYDGYQGAGKCLIPDLTVGGQHVGLFPSYLELGSSGLIRSARRGCFSRQVVRASKVRE